MVVQKTLAFLAVVLAAVSSLSLMESVSAQMAWGQLATQTVPPARAYHTLVHDPVRGRTVMFGGLAQDGSILTDTWEWDNSNWTQLFPAHSPSPARWGSVACFDRSRGTLVLFGGGTASAFLADTWEWDGSDWRSLATTGPSPRVLGGFAFDHANGSPVLVGGQGGDPRSTWRISDMWRLVGGVWQPILTAPLPPAATGALFCADPHRREIVFQGGSNVVEIDECWVWNGVTWRSGPTRGAYSGSASAYDPLRRRIVAFGGNRFVTTADTWEWDGAAWIQRSPSPSPSVRTGSRVAFDPVRGRILMFGGDGPPGSPGRSDETWEYFNLSQARYDNYGQGCSGTNQQVPQLDTVDDSLPWIGESWWLELRNLPATFHVPFGLIGTSRTTANGLPLPFNLGVIGMPGCLMLMSGDLGAAIIPSVQGRPEWTFSIPLDQQLVGANVFVQALVLNPGANDLGVIVSNGGDARVGMK
ncbi:MAG: hypothetical protein HZB39_12100 [Planctomycetes bacterium]|nr:hypothetical protein [Planctomycetota bacterium]